LTWSKTARVFAFAFVLATVALFGVVYAAPETNSSVEAAVAAPDTSVVVPAPTAAPLMQPAGQVQTHAAVAAPAVHASAPTTQPATHGPLTTPVAITSPKIGLNVPVVPVGLTPGHAVDVPNTLKLSGWYTGSPLPGARGSSLIDGHVGNSIGTPGVFANLHKLSIGDSIYVKDKNGNTEHFIVRDMKVYVLADVPMGYILANTNEKRLNIITCAGNWVPSQQTFDHRLVVYTELAP
jgi:LPXTG-site transpeptidase (sortase) family protein